MAPRPFPSPLHIGCDICSVSRIAKVLGRGFSKPRVGYMPFLRRLFSPRELVCFKAKFQNKNFQPHEWWEDKSGVSEAKDYHARSLKITRYDPAGGNTDREGDTARAAWYGLCRYVAGRWAAKEACIKAVKPRKVSPGLVEVWQPPGELYAIILEKQLENGRQQEARTERHVEREVLEGDEDDVSKQAQVGGGPQQINDQTRWKWLLAKDENLRVAPPSHEDIEGQIARLSISHDGDYAMAVAMAVSEPAAGDVGGEAAARQAGGE